MINFGLILIGIIILFGVFLIVRSIFSVKVCALCAAALTTWLILLAFWSFGQTVSPILLGILMGGSAVGIMYMLEQKLSAEYIIFKLPFFLTLITLIYFLLENTIEKLAIIILVILWIFLFVVHVNKNIPKFRALGKKIIECCKNW